MRNSTMTGSEVQDVAILRHWKSPVQAGQESIIGRLGRFEDSICRRAEATVMNIEATATHDILVENSSMLFVV